MRKTLASVGSTGILGLCLYYVQLVVVSCGEHEERVVSDLPEFHGKD